MAPTPWGTEEAPNQLQIQQMQRESTRAGTDEGGMAEFYNQFPWMKATGEGVDPNKNFSSLVNPEAKF